MALHEVRESPLHAARESELHELEVLQPQVGTSVQVRSVLREWHGSHMFYETGGNPGWQDRRFLGYRSVNPDPPYGPWDCGAIMQPEYPWTDEAIDEDTDFCRAWGGSCPGTVGGSGTTCTNGTIVETLSEEVTLGYMHGKCSEFFAMMEPAWGWVMQVGNAYPCNSGRYLESDPIAYSWETFLGRMDDYAVVWEANGAVGSGVVYPGFESAINPNGEIGHAAFTSWNPAVDSEGSAGYLWELNTTFSKLNEYCVQVWGRSTADETYSVLSCTDYDGGGGPVTIQPDAPTRDYHNVWKVLYPGLQCADLPPPPAMMLGTAIEKAVKPIARALKLPCLDKSGNLLPDSGCAKRRDALNALFRKKPR